ncbi:DNA polymerase II [Vibrio ishigakensis]|uniref:DNA-directed DNA polymerase n=1 Tax=Vibrio ishigakensis TaxID=1481914 RepID=A0A0B8QDA5_9VIBR|nr:DNA polymerase II [Vibrio ishigakensis]
MRSGFILTRQARDIGSTTQIDLWLSTDSGPALVQIPNQESVFFVRSADHAEVESLAKAHQIQCRYRALELQTFKHDKVTACYFKTQREARNFETALNEHGLKVFESDIRLADRYLMERFIQGQIEVEGTEHAKQGYLQISQAQARKAEHYTPNLCMVSLDLECSAKGVLYSVGLDCPRDQRVIMVGEPQINEGVAIQWVADEKSLLQALVQWFYQFDPDIIIGWNVIGFDMRLLLQRAQAHNIKLPLGRGRQECLYRQTAQNQNGFINVPGRVVIDGIDGLKAATYSFDSWSLENVSRELLHEGKAISNPNDRMDEINHMFHHDKLALAKYNFQDCALVTRIFEHTHLLDYLIERSKLTGLALDRIGGSVAAFSNLYLPRLHRGGYISPNLEPENWIASPGGFVMDSRPGLYDSVLVLDFKSLYPAIIRSFLIDLWASRRFKS